MEGTILISLCYFHSFMDIQAFFNFACEMTARIFNRIACNYQTASQWDLRPQGITVYLFDDGMLISVSMII